MAEFTVSSSPLDSLSHDVLLLPVFTAGDADSPQVPGHDDLTALIAPLEVSAGAEKTTRLPAGDVTSAGSIVLVGLGSASYDDLTPEKVRRAFGAAARGLAGTTSVAVALPGANEELLVAAAQGVGLGAYVYNEYKTDADILAKAPIAQVEVLVESTDTTSVEKALAVAAIENEASLLTRDFVNTPPNVLFPQAFVERVQEIVKDLPITVTVLDEKELAEGGYGGIVGVGQGSSRKPRLATLEYSPAGASSHVALVGKGITFDTGGISLKPGMNMDDMTSDMTGAATVFAATVAAARLELPVKVTTFLALAENMPGGGAQRPGDVVTMRNGMTVEVLNTDAEGRMVMADALVDAAALKPDVILDVATLTGAAVVALGERTAGVIGDDEPRAEVIDAAQRAGEEFWPMPMPAELREGLTGRVADLSNIGGRMGGMLSAGIFLKEFVDDIPWAHLDIAGPAFTKSPYGYFGKGGTGMSVRTVLEVIRGRA